MDRFSIYVGFQIIIDNLTLLLKRYAIMIASIFTIIILTFLVDTWKSISGKNLILILSLSKNTPWGILTSMFIHKDFYHLYYNILSFLYYSLILLGAYIIENIFIDRAEMSALSQTLAYIIVIFTSQTIPSIKLFFDIYNQQNIVMIYGLSQVVFGIIGLLGSSIFVPFSLFLVKQIEKTREIKPVVKILFVGVFSAWFFSSTIVVIGTHNFLNFIGVGIPEMNVEGHIYALLIGIILGALIISIKYDKLKFTLDKLRNPKKFLNVEKSREKVLIKFSQ